MRRVERARGIELVRTDPGDAAQQQDDHQRNGPDDGFDAPRKGPVRPVARARVRSPEPPRERQGGDHRRHHDHQHDRQRVEQNRLLGLADGPLRVEDRRRPAGAEQRRPRARNTPQPGTGCRRGSGRCGHESRRGGSRALRQAAFPARVRPIAAGQALTHGCAGAAGAGQVEQALSALTGAVHRDQGVAAGAAERHSKKP